MENTWECVCMVKKRIQLECAWWKWMFAGWFYLKSNSTSQTHADTSTRTSTNTVRLVCDIRQSTEQDRVQMNCGDSVRLVWRGFIQGVIVCVRVFVCKRLRCPFAQSRYIPKYVHVLLAKAFSCHFDYQFSQDKSMPHASADRMVG